ncbi:PhnD/SsuA/transferrin family substrate-binding protein [Methylomonas montana]|uniref:phosphate/phosphite/phosphonate ABC transporter substrate-binding protein n=1 Tax=Methylomonas montana TaxID=3058963 RepID=UPI0026595E47|nr:PhnD/SsuA/transferrin family substrate-binding protein [Methylomonas montana]WKJ88678.1 PhnD/SsuA/transferrin family substrate-binding protein [Methylomonas montana]
MATLIRLLLAVLIPTMFVAGCESETPTPPGPQYGDQPAEPLKPLYRLAVHPLHNPNKLAEAYQPLIGYLNRQISDAHFELEASRDYQVYEAKFRTRDPEILLANPWQTLEALKVGYQVIAMAGDAEDFKGLFIVRKDSGINTPADLKGKVVSYPSQTALAACIMPQYFLHKHGIDVNRDIQNRYVGSQESSIMNAYLGEAAAGATWPPPWRLFQKDHPQEAAELTIAWETPGLINNSVMVRNDVPAAIRDKLKVLILALDNRPEGKLILTGMETARFHSADDASYDVVRDYIADFEKVVRPVEQKMN